MFYSFLIAAAILIVLTSRYVLKPGERCPECGQKRQANAPICSCGWVFEYPDSDTPLDYEQHDGPEDWQDTKG